MPQNRRQFLRLATHVAGMAAAASTVTAPDFERRFAGRIETGEPGSSDPEMGLGGVVPK